MMQVVRVLGAFLGVIVALVLARFAGSDGGFFEPSITGYVLLMAWVGAWAVVGFLILPSVTFQPTAWLVRSVVRLSTGEFVTAVSGSLVGLLMGLLLGLPLSNLPAPYSFILPIGVSLVLGLGMMGLTVAKRQDLLDSARSAGLLATRTSEVSAEAEKAGQPIVIADTSAIIDGRIVDVSRRDPCSGR